MRSKTDAELHECIRACWACRDACQAVLFNHCLDQGGCHLRPDHVRLMMDCIQLCQVSADFMIRNSKMYATVCNTCAAVCDACARSCNEIGDREMKRCVQVCRSCAESCWDMAMHAGLAA